MSEKKILPTEMNDADFEAYINSLTKEEEKPKKTVKKKAAKSKIYAFINTKGKIELIGNSKEEFYSYIRENFDDVIEWTNIEIEEAINLGDIAEDHVIAIEIFDNGNEWVLCTSDADNILFTQKTFENSDSLSVDINESTIYFKPTSQLNADEKKLIED
jgi:hypothetical protein